MLGHVTQASCSLNLTLGLGFRSVFGFDYSGYLTYTSMGTSSSNLQPSSSHTPNFQPVFERALKGYKKKTGKDLTAHPLAAEIKGCASPQAILAVLEGKANELQQFQGSDERLTKWLNPTVNILGALSATLGQGAGLVSYETNFATGLCLTLNFKVFPPTTIIFSGIGILLVVTFLPQCSGCVAITLSLAGCKEYRGEPQSLG